MQFTEISAEDFKAFSLGRQQTAFPQSIEMSRVQKDLGRKVKFLALKDGDEILGAGLFLIKPYHRFFQIAHCNQGPILDFGDPGLVKAFFEGLEKKLRSMNILYCQITPNFPLQERDGNGKLVPGGFDHRSWHQNLLNLPLDFYGFNNDPHSILWRWFFIKDMRPYENEDDLWASFNYNTQRHLKKARKLPIQVLDLPLEEIDHFNRLMEQTSQRRGFIIREDLHSALKKEFGENCRVILSRLDIPAFLEESRRKKDQTQKNLKKAQDKLEANPNKSNENKVGQAQDQYQAACRQLEEAQAYEGKSYVDLGGALYLNYNQEVTYLFSASFSPLLNLNGIDLVMEEGIRWALETGARQFNYYGTLGKYSGTEDDGIHQFKRGYGGVVYETPGTYVLPVKKGAYRTIQKIKRWLGKRS